MCFHHIIRHPGLFQNLLTIPNLLTMTAIIIASIIGFRQIKISKRQMELSRRQFEVDAVRYAIDKAIVNKAELVEVVVNGKKALETEKNTKTVTFLNETILEANQKIGILNKKIPELIEKYHRVLGKNPNDFKLEEE